MNDNEGVMAVLQRMALKEERCLTGLEPCGTEEPCPACLYRELVGSAEPGAAPLSLWPGLPTKEWQFAPLGDAPVYPLSGGGPM